MEIIKLTHKDYGGEYNFNPKTNELSKELKIYGENGKVSYVVFQYKYYKNDYVEVE